MVSKIDSPDKGKAAQETLEGRLVSDASPGTGPDIMRDVLSKPSHIGKPSAEAPKVMTGIVIGTLSSIGKEGELIVHYPGIPGGKHAVAISTETLSDDSVGRDVALGFVNGDPLKPIVLGLIQVTESVSQFTSTPIEIGQDKVVKLDGEKVTLSAEKEIVLECGKSSITLTRAGKVIIKGAYLSNHSTGVNRIKGGSVQIN